MQAMGLMGTMLLFLTGTGADFNAAEAPGCSDCHAQVRDFWAHIDRNAEGFFTPPYPARSTVEVARLPKDVLVEIEVVAKK